MTAPDYDVLDNLKEEFNGFTFINENYAFEIAHDDELIIPDTTHSKRSNIYPSLPISNDSGLGMTNGESTKEIKFTDGQDISF